MFNLLSLNIKDVFRLVYLKGTSDTSIKRIDNISYLGEKRIINAIPKLYKKVLKEKPAQIICFNQEASLMLLPLCKFFKIRLISRCMNTPSMRMADKYLGYKSRVLTFIYVKFSHFFDINIFQCKCMKEDLLNNNPKLKNKIKIIYNPVPKSNNYIDLNLSLNHDSNINLIFVGRLTSQKNVKFY